MVYVPDSVSLLSGKNALILFFGVYLTVVINLIRKYRTFDIYLFFSKNKSKRIRSIRRFISGFIIIDVMPILWFLVLYTFIIPDEPGPFPIMAAAFAGLSILGFARILHSVIATEKHEKFYSNEDRKRIAHKMRMGYDIGGIGSGLAVGGLTYALSKRPGLSAGLMLTRHMNKLNKQKTSK